METPRISRPDMSEASGLLRGLLRLSPCQESSDIHKCEVQKTVSNKLTPTDSWTPFPLTI